MEFVVQLGLFVFGLGVSVVPVKLAVDLVGGQNRSWFSCVMAVICAGAAQWGTWGVGGPVGLLIGLLVSGAVYCLVLGTSFFKGVIIALIQIILIVVTFVVIRAIGVLLSGGSINMISGAGGS
jgi:hypothetical protein